MARPVVKWPKKNVVTFRLSDPEYAALKFYARHLSHDGESFSDTLSRVLRDFIEHAAVKQLEFIHNVTDGPGVALPKDKPAERRKRYALQMRKAAEVVKKAVEDGLTIQEDVPTLVDVAMARANEKLTSHEKFTSQGSFANPAFDVSLALRGGTHYNTGDGEPTTKTLNFASPSGAAGQRPAESAGKIEDFSEDLENSGFLSGGGLDERA